MTLKPRPLVRETATFRDDRLFIVACEDTYAPKHYFDIFQIPRVQIHVVPTQDGRSSPQHVLERLLAFDHAEHDQRWLLLDIDHRNVGPHVKNLVDTIREAQQRGIHIAVCNPCFELWLLLHHQDVEGAFGKCSDVERALKKTLGSYNKRRLDIDSFKSGVVAACTRARQLDQGDIPEGPSAQVHRILEAFADGVPDHQLPQEFRALRTI